jgi:predicted Zn-dependent peptidase
LVKEHFKSYPFTFRNPKLVLDYQQEFSSVTKEKVERKEANQSILELAYHLQTLYKDVNYPALVVFNSLFGSSAHSKLFRELREKEGLAYTVGSSIHIFSGMLRVYAGIDKDQRLKTMQLIRQQLSDVKLGKFTDEDLMLTKKVLTNAATLAQDRPSTLMEQAYNQSIFCQDFRTYSQWIDSVNLVSREDVMVAAKQIKLQAVYFMEGVG